MIPIDEPLLTRLYWSERLSTLRIGARLGLSTAQVRRLLHLFGIPVRSKNHQWLTIPERFMNKWVEGENGCWIWQAAKNSAGYGHFCGIMAHRWSYEHFRGPIPPGLTLDHLCRTPACVNPDHLEPVTMGENLRRGISPNMIAHRENRCRKGHVFTPENTYVHRSKRYCRVCRRERKRLH